MGPRALLVSVGLAFAVWLPGVAAAAPKAQPILYAGAGQADITPPQTGYFLGGWTLAYRVALGQSTRLYANVLVLRRGAQKLALVEADLFAITAGMQSDVAAQLADLGFSRQNILLQASHTHSGPGGWTNNPTYNSAAPDTTASFLLSDPSAYVKFLTSTPANKQLYTFLVDRIAVAIRRANADLAPAEAGWGHADLVGITQNRSLEAHLANFGVNDPTYGTGKVSQDPGGYIDTIDPSVDVLRVDKLLKRHVRCTRRPRRTCVRTVAEPIGAWSTFADHGTVVHSFYGVYSGDHLGVAMRTLSAAIRQAGHVPARQTVVDVYPNADEGDQTAALQHLGPSGADTVGQAEAAKMFEAWRAAGTHMTRTPALALRWTVSCFCGQMTATGRVASAGAAGVPFLTGAPEGRGPLYDHFGLNLSGIRSPFSSPTQGDKLIVPFGSFPPAVPISVIQIGSGAIASVPGEATVMVGQQFRRAVLTALAPVGVNQVAIGGLANDYIQYVTTPAEYHWQSYEGGSTLFGPNEATFLQERLVELATDLTHGKPAPMPYNLDPAYGIHANGPPYPSGASSATITTEPAADYGRLAHAQLAWTGGPDGHDRPLDTAFVRAQQLRQGKWTTVDSDLALNMIWRVDSSGHYTVEWEIPLSEPVGTYRLLVTATRYALASTPFGVAPNHDLQLASAPEPEGRVGVVISYAPANPLTDLTSRPTSVVAGSVDFLVNGRTVTGGHRANDGAGVFSVRVPPGARVTVPAGYARDRSGNISGVALTLQ
jgi:neutral ceramidase